MKLEFRDVYKIGIRKIDEQHAELFDVFNRLERAIARGDGNEVISEILEFLIAYSKEHFDTEEGYMEKYKYPDLSSHKEIHREFLSEVDEMYQRYQDGYLKINIQTQETLFNWITTHIEQTDKRYGMYLMNKIKGNA